MSRSDAGFIQKWQLAGRELVEMERDELRSLTDADVGAAIQALSQAFWVALHSSPPSQTSGLIEQQRLFMRGRSLERPAERGR